MAGGDLGLTGPPICATCGVTMVPGALSADEGHEGEWVCLECEELALETPRRSAGWDDEPVIVREQWADEHEAIRRVYAEAFRRPGFRPPQSPGSLPPEVALFEALWESGDVIPELSFSALSDGEVVGHVTASRAAVAADPVVAVGPIGVLPDRQGNGIGSALMDAHLAAADAADVPLVVLLGAPQYYGRFGFRPAEELGVMSPEPEWGDAFQARPLTAYTDAVTGPFRYAPAFSL